MKIFDNFSIHNRDALTGSYNLIIGRDLALRQRNSRIGGRKNIVCYVKLRRMDQRFAIKAKCQTLLAFCAQTCLIFKAVINSVNCNNTMRPRCQDDQLQARLQGKARIFTGTPQFMDKIISAGNDPLKARMRRNLGGIQHALRRGGYILEDLGSTNGSWINGERMVQNAPMRIQSSDTLRFGRHIFTFYVARDFYDFLVEVMPNS